MTIDSDHPPETAELEAARLLLTRMGVRPEDLLATPAEPAPTPTFAEYIPTVAQAVSVGTRRVYRSYWNRIAEHWGHRRLDEPTPSEIKTFAEHIKSQVVIRRNGRGGRCAAEHFIAALRCLYHHALADGLMTEADNPARKVPKPRRLPSNRRGLADERLAEINRVAATTGDDPALDTLLLRLHIETACRRGGALALRRRDLDEQQCLIVLREKGQTWRWQPVSPTLMNHLQAHAEQRNTDPDTQLLRYANGHPLTYRRYDYLWKRLGEHLPWVAAQQISTHWLRHTTLTWVERTFSYAIARAYAGHTDGRGNDPNTTATYVRADITDIATALAALTGEPHPLAHPDPPQPAGQSEDTLG